MVSATLALNGESIMFPSSTLAVILKRFIPKSLLLVITSEALAGSFIVLGSWFGFTESFSQPEKISRRDADRVNSLIFISRVFYVSILFDR